MHNNVNMSKQCNLRYPYALLNLYRLDIGKHCLPTVVQPFEFTIAIKIGLETEWIGIEVKMAISSKIFSSWMELKSGSLSELKLKFLEKNYNWILEGSNHFHSISKSK